MEKISVLLVDDHTVVRQGLSALLAAYPDIEIVGEAADGRQALALAKSKKPAIVLMDLALPLLNGVAATRAILREVPQTRIIVLTSYGDDENVRQAIAAGATGFLLKHTAANDLLNAIHEVHQGNAAFSPAIARRLRDQSRGPAAAKRSTLTLREAQVLQLVSEGLPNKQIADALGISIKTVEKHRQQVMNKLGIHDVASLTRYALSQTTLHPELASSRQEPEGATTQSPLPHK
ncbi:MAG TPA: response regulator transcription factor [Candidatus Sulfotelmatobacter sp.]|nr:response regulator transcription factor [Candidatus Sulfotelmatobacter sp.]